MLSPQIRSSPAGSLTHPLARKLLVSFAVPAAACLAYWPLRMAWADRLSRAAGAGTVARAVRLAPGNADFRLRLAGAQQAVGADPTATLAAAAALDPGNAESWIRLGGEAEMRGDLSTAQSRLLEAAHVSNQFAPRWALANFYFRRGDARHFWPWVKESLRMSYGDLNPVFRLCWNMSQDAGLILDRAIPERREVLNGYIWFLMQEGRLAASEPAAMKLAALGTLDDQWALVFWCNRQIDVGSPAAALEVWNRMCARHILPFAHLDRDRAPLTDGAFGIEFSSGGFAWRQAPGAGVGIGRNRSPLYRWVAFSGEQPETCAPLVQFVPLTPNARYAFRFDYRTAELPLASGLRWTVCDARTGTDLAPGSTLLSCPDWNTGEVRFTAPPAGLVRVSLVCRRLPGATRIEGSVALRRASMERLP